MVAEKSAKKLFSVTLRVWRQAGPSAPGKFVDYPAANVNPDMSFGDLATLLVKVKKALLEIKIKGLDGEAAKAVMKREVAPMLLKVRSPFQRSTRPWATTSRLCDRVA